MDLKEALAEAFSGLQYEGSVDRFVAYWFTKDSVINADVLGVVARLAELSSVELYLATGQEHYRANFLWNDLGFKEHFKEIFYSAKLGHLKNTPEFFETINRMLDISPPERPLYFDDQMEIVALACEAGWDASMFESAEDVVNHRQIRDLLTE